MIRDCGLLRTAFVIFARFPRRAATAAVALTSVVALASGCSSGAASPNASSTGSPASSANAITIKDFKFLPTPLNAKVGDTITVTNEDSTDHQLRAKDGSFDSGRFASGSKTFTLTKAGTFAYYCDVHDYMTGVIQVTGS